MNLTENEMRGLMQGKCLPADIRVGESVPAYLMRKFDALQQQVNALAAENLALKTGVTYFACGRSEERPCRERV